jgi:hypothetical protein
MATGIRAFYVYIALLCYGSRAVNPDLDPAFQVDPDTDPDTIWSQGFDDPKTEEKVQKICYLFLSTLQFTDVLASGEAFSPLKTTSIQHFKNESSYRTFFYVCGSFLELLDPNSDCESGYGSRNPIEFRIWIRFHSTVRIYSHPFYL